MNHNAIAINVRTRIIYSALAIMTIMFSMGKDLMAQTNTSTAVQNVVLVHGGLVDGSGWKGVYKALKKDGYTVTIVQNPTISLTDDVAVAKRAIAAQNGPVILVGHSYGSSDHGSGQRSKGRRPCLRHGVRTGQRRIGGVPY